MGKGRQESLNIIYLPKSESLLHRSSQVAKLCPSNTFLWLRFEISGLETTPIVIQTKCIGIIPNVRRLVLEFVAERISVQDQIDNRQSLKRIQLRDFSQLKRKKTSRVQKNASEAIESYLIVSHVEDLQIREFLHGFLQETQHRDLVVEQIQRFQLGDILRYDLNDRQENYRLEQGTEVVLQVRIRVELRQVQGFGLGRVAFGHDEFHFVFCGGVHVDVGGAGMDPDDEPEAVG